MSGVPVGLVRAPRRIVSAALALLVAAAAGGTATPAAALAAAPAGLLSLAKLETSAEPDKSPWSAKGSTELRRKSAKRAQARSFKARAARLMARYRRMAKLRSRVPASVRKIRARRELAQMQRKGPVHCLATAIYHEARYESARGQRAVAEVVLARTRTRGRPKSVCGVVYEGAWRATGCQFSFTCDGLSDRAGNTERWSRAKRIAREALARKGKSARVARGASHYHAAYVRPRWAKRMRRVARIGTHIFYRPR
jgi:spore germination cell wall hydrolase CwlJ-like protein